MSFRRPLSSGSLFGAYNPVSDFFSSRVTQMRNWSDFFLFLPVLIANKIPSLVFFGFTVFVILFLYVSLVPRISELDARDIRYGRDGSCSDFKSEDFFVFLQISDLHVARSNADSTRQFTTFVRNVVPLISPSFVLLTGDIVDAKENAFHSKKQIEDEWQFYRATLENANLARADFWIDMRGNHDDFGVVERGSEHDFFSRYAISPSLRDGNETFIFERPFGRYRFVFFDPTLNPGLPLPYNFWGIVPKDAMGSLFARLQMPELFNHTFLAAHHPLATIRFARTPEGVSFGKMADVTPWTAYLCGHYHRPHMYSRDGDAKNKFLRLEIRDHKESRIFRIVTLDNDLFTFSDVVVEDWPYVHVMNPKDSRFLSLNEPWTRIKDILTIRVLVFSFTAVESVTVFVGRKGSSSHRVYVSSVASSSNPALFEIPWPEDDRFLYSKGLHNLVVVAKTVDSRESRSELTFSFDGTMEVTSFFGIAHFFEVYQRFPMVWLLKIGFSVIVVYCLFFLLLLPKVMKFILKFQGSYASFEQRVAVFWGLSRDAEGLLETSSILHRTFLKFQTTMYLYGHMNPGLWIILVSIAVWAVIGPYAFGPSLLPNASYGGWGGLWVGGAFVNGEFVEADDGYFFAFLILSLNFLPVIVLCSTITGLLPGQSFVFSALNFFSPFSSRFVCRRLYSLFVGKPAKGQTAPVVKRLSYAEEFVMGQYLVRLYIQKNRWKLRLRNSFLFLEMAGFIVWTNVYAPMAWGVTIWLLSPMYLWLTLFECATFVLSVASVRRRNRFPVLCLS